ncbi:MAG: patatin-like phospholipase family protein [Pseudomonadota bacterium]
MAKAGRARQRKKINLGLQGGGAHGAYTWGVIDRLLEDERLDIEGVTGTSAGAMNAVVLADGIAKGGRDGARESLTEFWRAVSKTARASPIQRSALDMLFGNWSLDSSPTYLFFDVLTRFSSPYDFNPFDINPLRDVVRDQVDFDAVRSVKDIKVFVAATNVHSGKIRVFDHDDISLDAVMASACLPHVFKAVEIDGVPYWDGGYMGNPPLFPLFYNSSASDTIIIQINPIERPETPKTARDIVNRLNEITFNATLLRELRAIDFVTRLIDDGKLDSKEYMRVYLHRISADEDLKPLSASSKLNAEWAFLTHLRDIGRRAADHWLAANFDRIGNESTLDLRAEFS